MYKLHVDWINQFITRDDYNRENWLVGKDKMLKEFVMSCRNWECKVREHLHGAVDGEEWHLAWEDRNVENWRKLDSTLSWNVLNLEVKDRF